MDITIQWSQCLQYSIFRCVCVCTERSGWKCNSDAIFALGTNGNKTNDLPGLIEIVYFTTFIQYLCTNAIYQQPHSSKRI